MARKSPWTVGELTSAIPTALSNAAQWKLTASHNADAAPNALGTSGARWDTGAPQAAGQWFQIELPEATTIAEVQIDSSVPGARGRGGFGGGALPASGRAAGLPGGPPTAGAPQAAARAGAPPVGIGAAGAGRGGGRGGPAANGPVAYSVQVSTNGTTWSAPVATGAGATPTTIMAFTPVSTKFVRITQTGSAQNGEWWAIQQVHVYKK
jgi:hypothetical protein